MSVATMNDRIGAPPHLRRNLWILAAVITGIAAMTGFYAAYGRTDAVEMNRLAEFRAAFADKCEAPEFAEPVAPMVRDMYLTSPSLRDVIDRQTTALDTGADCEAVWKALRAADYPMPPPSAPRPTINLRPSESDPG